jgi:hypothetical protein
MRPVQYFTDEYLKEARRIPVDGVAGFLEDFRRLHGPRSKSRLISMKVPEPLLHAFKLRCRNEGTRYQTKIKQLMLDWLEGAGESRPPSPEASVARIPKAGRAQPSR